MAQASASMLDTGDAFPAMELAKLGGGTMHLPADLHGRWGVILFYRGHW
jgi:peroxiredoxin